MCHNADYSVLDQPEVVGIVFYPRKNWNAPPAAARDYLIPVADGVSVSARFYPARDDSPIILYFHGNGEVACDYDWVAPAYKGLGISLFVADYRGYGRSGGAPAFSTMVKDAHQVASFFFETLRLREQKGPLFLMGRSLGTTSALEIAFHYGARFSGLIIESGSANFLGVLGHHGFPVDAGRTGHLTEALLKMVSAITLPSLIMHGDCDVLIPRDEAQRTYNGLGSKTKRLVMIPGAGHNDIMVTGARVYFAAIKKFVEACSREV